MKRNSARIPIRYEAAWSDSSCYCRCFHTHPTLIEAAKCGAAHPGFYVVAVESGETRELTVAENKIVDGFRFGTLADSATP
jgi:hypothetical protein